MAARHTVVWNSNGINIEVLQPGDTWECWQAANFSMALHVVGALTVDSTVDGRDIAADGTKLDLLTATGAIDLDAMKVKTDYITVTQAVDLDALESSVAALSNVVVLKGTWDASINTFPVSTAAGESWIVSVAATVNGVPFAVNDRVVAIVDGASTTLYANNWHKLDYTDEVQSVAGYTGVVTLATTDLTDGADLLTEPDIDSLAKLNVLVGETLDTASDTRTPAAHTHPLADLTGVPVVKSYTFSSRSASSGEYFLAGGYEYDVADANLTQASTTQVFGTANSGYGSKAFMVFGAGSTDGTDITVTVTGTSIDHAGVRTAADSEVLYDGPPGSLTLNDYLETTKKWIGQVTYTLTSDGVNFTCDFNYGLAKYEDNDSQTFDLESFEITGLCDVSDSGFDVEVLLHAPISWTYHATAFQAGGAVVASWATDLSTESELIAGEMFAWKRTGLATSPSAGEGILIRVTTTANNAVKYMNAHIGAYINPAV